MGAANCCKRPDEIVIDEVKYASTDNNKIMQVDQDSYPQDTEQVHKSNVNVEEENVQGQTVSNQNLYEQEVGSPKIGGVYEVPINVSSPQQNYEEGYESNNMGSPQQYENQQQIQSQNYETGNLNQYEQEEQAGYQYEENENINRNINKRMSGEGNEYGGENQEGGMDYATLVNRMGNEANLKALGMGNLRSNKISTSTPVNYSIQQSQNLNYNISRNNIENSGGLNLNAFGPDQQGGVDLKNLTLGEQQKGNNISQSVRQIGYNNIGTSQQQTSSNIMINNQMPNMNNFGQKGQTNFQMSENDNLNKYFQQASSRFASVNSQQIGNENLDNFYSRAKTTAPVDLKQLAFSSNAQQQGGLDINKFFQQKNINTHITQKSDSVASVTPISTKEDINKFFKQQTNNASVQQSNSPNNLDQFFQKAVSQRIEPIDGKNNFDNSKQIKVTKVNIDMEDLPETFGSSDINNFKQKTITTATVTKEISPDYKINIDMKNFNLDMKDLPETFGSSDINKNVKQTTTTTTTTIKKEGDVDLNNIKIDMKNFNLDMKDLPEAFGSSDINKKVEQTTTTTTTTVKKEGDVDLNNIK